MNKTYRLIWSAAKDAWVLAAETVKGKGGPAPLTRALLAVASVLALASGAQALPTGSQVVNGTVSMATQGNTLTVTNTPNSIINWQGFSIAAGETTRFVQQSATSAVLNRVVGVDPSSIMGTLQSNGRIFLLNPNGIIFGQGSRVDAAGLVASSLNMSDADFMGGRYLFNAGPSAGSVKNQGEITAPSGGHVWLIAPNVENSGIITSPGGTVTLAAGQSVHVVDPNKPEVAVVVSAPTDQAVNLGSIVAPGGRIGMYGAIVGHKGTINANSATRGENGRIYFKSTKSTTIEAGSVTTANGPDGGSIIAQTESGDTMVSGTISATGTDGTGGAVQLLGQRVGLIDNANIDASGTTGGGTILVGGDYQGKNPDIRNAQATYIGKDVTIKADATDNGDGGKVIVWADDTTRAYGSISARGGASGGNGGFVETSGKSSLDVNGISVSTAAQNGKLGNWLLDPSDILITSAGLGTLSGGFFDPVAASGSISWSTIEGGLAGGNVMVSTTSGVGGAGDITADDGYNFTNAGAGVLTLNAGRDIVLNTLGAPITGNPLGITLQAGRNVRLNNGISLLSAPINITASTGDVSGPGILDSPTVNITAALGILVNTSYTLAPSPMSLSLNNTGAAGMIAVTDTSNYGLNLISAQQSAAGQPIAISHAGNMLGFNLNGPVTTNGGAVSLTSSTTLTSAMTFIAAADISTSGGGINLQNSAANTSINLPAGTLLNSGGGPVNIQSDNMTLAGGAGSINAGSGTVLLAPTTAGTIFNIGTGAADGAGTLGIDNTELANIITTGGLIIGTGGSTGDLSIVGATTFATPTTLLTGGGIFINNPVNAGANNLTLSAGQAITGGGVITASSLLASAATGIGLTGANNVPMVTLNNSTSTTISYSSDVGAGQPLTISAVTAGGDINISEANGNINLQLTKGGMATISATMGSIIDGDGPAVNVFANILNMSAYSGIGTAADAIETVVANLNVSNGIAGDIAITNNSAAAPAPLTITNMTNGSNGIIFDSFGPVTTSGPISAGVDITLKANSPLTIGVNGVTSSSGKIILAAGPSGTAGAGDNLTINGPVSANGNISLYAGDSIIENAAITSSTGIITRQSNMNQVASTTPLTTAALMTESTVVQGINIAVIPTEESDPASKPAAESDEEKAKKEAKAKKDAEDKQNKKGEEGPPACN